MPRKARSITVDDRAIVSSNCQAAVFQTIRYTLAVLDLLAFPEFAICAKSADIIFVIELGFWLPIAFPVDMGRLCIFDPRGAPSKYDFAPQYRVTNQE